MQPSEVRRAVAAALSTASKLGLGAEDAIDLSSGGNRLAVRLTPCDVLARVMYADRRAGAEFEVEIGHHLARTECPAATPDPRVEPRVYEQDGFVVTLWTYHEPAPHQEVGPADYADALERLHAGMRQVAVATPHFTDRVAGALQIVGSRDVSPELADADRELLAETLHGLGRTITDRGAPEQLLHGEPHPGNLLSTKDGLLFIDLETCCRGPVEFDIAHAPEAVAEHYAEADRALVRQCRVLSLALIAAWRWDRRDNFPNGRAMGLELLAEIRAAVS